VGEGICQTAPLSLECTCIKDPLADGCGFSSISIPPPAPSSLSPLLHSRVASQSLLLNATDLFHQQDVARSLERSVRENRTTLFTGTNGGGQKYNLSSSPSGSSPVVTTSSGVAAPNGATGGGSSSGDDVSSQFKSSESFGVVGLATSVKHMPMVFMFEYGSSSYSSKTDGFPAKGSVNYTGISSMARLWADQPKDNLKLSFDLGLRVGSVSTSLRGSAITSRDDIIAKHETSSTYTSLLLNSAVDYHVDRRWDVAGFLRISQLYLGATEEKMNATDHLKVEATTTSRLELGGRAERTMVRGIVAAYVEIAGEYQTGDSLAGEYTNRKTTADESSGAVTTTRTRTEVDSLNVSGISFKEEIGARIKLMRDPKTKQELFSINLNLNAQQGNRSGFGGGIGVRGEW
jgi:hypothetical protein